MFNDDFNDNVWDEHDWEVHLNEVERKSTQLRQFLSPDSTEKNPRWLNLLSENPDELDAVDAFIEEELQIDETYFPGEEDDDEWDEETDNFLFDDLEDEDFLFDEFDDEEDFNNGEEWKELSEEFSQSGYGTIETLNIFNDARELAAVILKWTETTNPEFFTPSYNNFIGNVLKIGAKIAGGYSFGFDQEFLGGNIAYTKRALYCANDALTILQRDLKQAPYMPHSQYQYFHQQLFELRNGIGIYIQELREQFYNSY